MGKTGRKKKPSFEEAKERLAAIVTELETEDLSLDDSLARYEEGRLMIRHGYELLTNAERKVEALLEGEDGGLETKPFDAGADEEADA